MIRQQQQQQQQQQQFQHQQQHRSSYRSRTLSPRPVDKTLELDQKLDNLLENLQVTLNESTGGSSSNSSTLTKKYGSQTNIPISQHRLQNKANQSNGNYKAYKTAKYSYNTSTDNLPQETRYNEMKGSQSNLSQLDVLLNDLKHVNMGSNNNIGTSSVSINSNTGNGNLVRKEQYVFKTSSNDISPRQIEQSVEYSGEGGSYGEIRKYIQSPSNFSTEALNTTMATRQSTNERVIPIGNNSNNSSRNFVYRKVESSKKAYNDDDRPITPRQKTVSNTASANKYNATVTTRTTEYSPAPTPPPVVMHCSTPNKKIFVYKEVTTKNVTDIVPPQPKPQEPSKRTLIIKENKETKNTYLPPTQPVNPKTEVEILQRNEHVLNEVRPQIQPQSPASNTIYNLKSETHNNLTNNYINYSNNNNSKMEKSVQYPMIEEKIDGPPKKVDDLMASLKPEHPPPADDFGFEARNVEVIREKKYNEAKNIKNGHLVNGDSKKSNGSTAGPPVYYPPCTETVTKREEIATYANGKGQIMRESGKYLYEAESGGKSKTKSGATVIPFCLPLCCGLPCTIM